MENTSLLRILQNDEQFGDILKRRTQLAKKDKESLLNSATQYNQKYKNEIEEGDKLRHKLLEEGKSKGLTKEEDIFKGNSKFMPTVRTPILNFLFFMLRDEEQCKTKTIQEVIEEFLHQNGYEKTEEVQHYIDGIVQNFSIEQTLDELGDGITFEDTVSKDTTKEVEDIGEFLYGNLTLKEFNTVKKLKALSRSENKDEAFSAYSKCLELCKKYNIEFDRIPCNIK
jgi:hypothetical protein